MRCCVVLVALFLGVSGCHETRKPSQKNSPTEKNVVKPIVEYEPLEVREERAFVAANDLVERARIFSVPVQPLAAERIQGVALPLYPELPNVKWEDNLKWISETGASYVSLVVSWDQRTIHHNRLQPDPNTAASDERIEEVVKEAKRLGLKVMIFPIIHVELRNPGEWRGKLAPTDRKRWNKDYRAYVMQYAKLSERAGVDIYSVGSELSSLERDEVFWEQLIADVRATYQGKLIYSANWDHYETPKFWDKLDYVGVSAYFEVAKREDEPMFVVTDRWRKHRDRIVSFAKKQKRPVILTEVGYPSIDSAATKPWDYTAKTPPNQNAQLAAFHSMSDAWSRETSEYFGGMFIWHGWGAGGEKDISYSFWNKHAHEFVEAFYSQ